MQICRHDGLEKDFKDLKRFAAPRESLDAWERLFLLKGLRETPSIEQFPGFGERKIYKARVVPLRENVGKSKGYRVIFEITNAGTAIGAGGETCTILVFSRHGIYASEGELFALIRERMEI